MEEKLKQWIKGNKQILNKMFSGNLITEKSVEQDRKFVKAYFTQLTKIWEDLPDRNLLAHYTITKSIANYFYLLDWDYGFEIPIADLDSNYRFDLMAQKGAKVIVVEVKPKVTTRDLGQVLGYLFDVKKKAKKSRVFLGTDILNFYTIVDGGEITDIITDNAKHGLGVIFADKEQAWIIPPEFLLI